MALVPVKHSVLCTISALLTVADLYSADNMSQIVNLKAIYCLSIYCPRCANIQHHYFAV